MVVVMVLMAMVVLLVVVIVVLVVMMMVMDQCKGKYPADPSSPSPIDLPRFQGHGDLRGISQDIRAADTPHFMLCCKNITG